MAGGWQALADEALGLASDYVRSGGVRIALKTNFGPEVTVATADLVSGGSGGGGGGGGSGSLLELLGVRAGVVVRDRNGNRLASYGDYPETEPLRVALLLGLVAVLGFVLVRGVTK